MIGEHYPLDLLDWVDQCTPIFIRRAYADAMFNGMITGFEVLDELEPEGSIVLDTSQSEEDGSSIHFHDSIWEGDSPDPVVGRTSFPTIGQRHSEFSQRESIHKELFACWGDSSDAPAVPTVAVEPSTCSHEATFSADAEQQVQDDSQRPHPDPAEHISAVRRIASNFKESFETAWNDLRSLRHYFVREYRKMRRIARKFTSPALSRVLSTLRGPKDLRNRGILTFKDVIRGVVTDDLTNIFALLTMSYAMSKVLVAKEKIKPADVLSGLNLWRDIVCDHEREDFSRLAESLWPEAKSQLQTQKSPDGPDFDITSGVGFGSVADIFRVDLGSITNAFAKSQILESTMGQAGVWAENFRFQNLSAENYSPPRATPIGGNLRSTQAFSTGPGYTVPPNLLKSVWYNGDETEHCIDPQLLSSIEPPMAAAKQNIHRPSIEALHETSIFRVVYAFAQGEIFDLLFILSGKGATVRYYRRGFSTDQDQRVFETKVTEGAFARLRTGDSREIPGLQALVSAAETFVRLACLRSLDHVREFVLEVAQIFAHDETYRVNKQLSFLVTPSYIGLF
ncbi:hypothetical protein SAPIO_CDS0600 [Scedosporium apiospermum]|uniref:Uncharacterized protein n=1 Tax=Pseudallescheria apiosperma TaxID=563466 RepID=A0A084GG43_PSEDA|nr:uncharacterized protein SAPIO_CDS0600 [Scedosporium apiospermum]KEZ46305.1 hypothetical protein SAPIO_CDS0600 [Scedosporium apiospermum]